MIHPPKRLRKRPGIIEIKINGILPFPPPDIDLVTIARGIDCLMRIRRLLQVCDHCLADAPG